MSDPRVIVVGTTSDYVDYLQNALPGRLFFLTDPEEYHASSPESYGKAFHLVFPLKEDGEVLGAVKEYKEKFGFEISGVACFDCQSLLLASEIAQPSHPFPKAEVILDCRDKYRSKKIWESRGVFCPKCTMAFNESEAASFFDSVGGPVVLKPTVLSGSELTFICRDRGEVIKAFASILRGMDLRKESSTLNRDGLISADSVLCEECIVGTEYSSDFIYENGRVEIIRIAKKHLLSEGPAGTAQAYELPAQDFPLGIPDFQQMLKAAVEALGLERCMGMADFIIRGKTLYFLEISPRPAGDCLPQLILRSSGIDTLIANIDFSEGRPVEVPDSRVWKHLIGLRVHSRKAGLLRSVRLRREGLAQEIIEENWIRTPGDSINLPPDDYQSWMLGHVIFKPVPGIPSDEQVLTVREAVEIKVEEGHDR
ncbi:MAG: ATP-grasp domain-containing protein [Candidatus Krumholzibacteriota bacterium]|nr:ATP-grasp domain-containing protein [Candidatus Krumholzibacteriota bacterium]